MIKEHDNLAKAEARIAKHIIIGLIILAFWLTALTGCASKTTLTGVAKKWQRVSVTYGWTEQVAGNPDILEWKARIAKDGWTDTTTKALIKYLHKKTSYSFSGPCGNPKYWCSPLGFQNAGYKGVCVSLTGYHYHVFRYLDYPRGLRMAFVRIWGMSHHILMIEMTDGSWQLMNSNTFFGLEKFDEIFYQKVIQFDYDGVY